MKTPEPVRDSLQWALSENGEEEDSYPGALIPFLLNSVNDYMGLERKGKKVQSKETKWRQQ
jgi:hypothetical protein